LALVFGFSTENPYEVDLIYPKESDRNVWINPPMKGHSGPRRIRCPSDDHEMPIRSIILIIGSLPITRLNFPRSNWPFQFSGGS